MMKFSNTNRGFSLLESMVAIGILLVAVVAPLSTIGDSLAQIYVARDQMVAINLAQEGIEAVRQVRDSNMIKGWNEGTRTTDWDAGLGEGNYTVDTEENLQIKSLTAGEEGALYQKTDGTYTQTAGVGMVPTKFSRIVTISSISGVDYEKKITSRVSWKTAGGTDKKIEVSESLFGINTTP